MLSLITALKNKPEGKYPLTFDDQNEFGVLWDANLDLTLQEFGMEIQESGEEILDGEVLLLTLKLLGSQNKAAAHYIKEDKSYVSFIGLGLTASEWLGIMGYQDVLRNDLVAATEADKKLALQSNNAKLSQWLYVMFKNSVERIHIFGLDDLGNVVDSIQVPDDSIDDEPVDDADYSNWLEDASVSLLANFE